MYKCKHCGKEFETKQKLAGHTVWCKENPNKNGKCNFHTGSGKDHFKEYNAERDDLYCRFCGKQCKSLNSLNSHERSCPENKDRNYFSYTLGLTAWNKGLTAETDERVAKYTKTLKEYWLSSEGESMKKIFSEDYTDNELFKAYGRKGGLIGADKQQKKK